MWANKRNNWPERRLMALESEPTNSPSVAPSVPFSVSSSLPLPGPWPGLEVWNQLLDPGSSSLMRRFLN